MNYIDPDENKTIQDFNTSWYAWGCLSFIFLCSTIAFALLFFLK